MRIVLPFVDRSDNAKPALLAAVSGALVLALLGYVATSRKKTSSQPRRRVHTLPTRSAILGDLAEMGQNAERLHEWLYETSLRFHGEPWNFYLPGIMNTTVLTTPELIEEVLGTQSDIFIRGKVTHDIIEDFMGKSFVAADGERWYHQRKATTKFFSGRALRSCMAYNMRKNVGQLNTIIDQAAATGEPLDMLPLFQEFAMQTFAEIALGIELDIIGTSETHVLEHAIREGGPVVMRRGSLPTFWWKLERWLNIGPERKIKAGMKAARAWLNKTVPESLAAISARHQQVAASGRPAPTGSIKSMMELFIEQIDDADSLKASDLPEIILALVIGSRGTTASSMAWIFLLLMKHPEVQQKVRDEMASKLPHATEDSYVTSEEVVKLVYLEATLKEAVRLYPTLPLNQRIANADTVIGGSIPIQKGDDVFISMYTMARLPSVWGPDAAEFKPERWINQETGELINYPANKFLTFSTGARACIGMRLAMLELRILTVNLLKRYRFSLAEPNDMSHIVSTELLPAQPLVMHWTRVPLTPAAA